MLELAQALLWPAAECVHFPTYATVLFSMACPHPDEMSQALARAMAAPSGGMPGADNFKLSLMTLRFFFMVSAGCGAGAQMIACRGTSHVASAFPYSPKTGKPRVWGQPLPTLCGGNNSLLCPARLPD